MRAVLLIAAFSAILNAAPRLVLSTSTVSVPPIALGSNGPAQNLEAKNAGDGSLNLTASSSASWLSATAGAAGACTVLTGTCNQIRIALSTSSLAAGSYTEFITLTDPNAIDSPQQIAVSVLIGTVPDSVTLYVNPVGSAASVALSFIYPASAVTGAVSTTSGGHWLSFTPKGQSLIPLPDTIQAEALNGLAPGTYSGSIVIAGSTRASDNKTIKVTMVVSTGPVIDLSGITTVQIPGYQGGGTFTTYLAFNTIGTGPGIFSSGGSTIAALNITGASSSAAFLSAAVYSPNTISITADAGSLSLGTYHGAVTIASNAANTAAVSVPVDFVVGPSGVSVIFANGIVNFVSYASEPFAPGEIVALFGSQLAAPGTSASNPGLPPLATTLGGSQILVNGTPAPLFYVSPGQINFQIPYSAPVGQPATVQVVSANGLSSLRPMTFTTGSPRVLVFEDTYAIAINTDGSFALPSSIVVPPYVSHPAKPGDTLVLYGVGFGQTSPAAVEGNAATSVPLQNAPATTVTFGGGPLGSSATAIPIFSGLTPSAVGLYQINVTVPPDAPFASSVPVTVTVGNAVSNVFDIAISADGH